MLATVQACHARIISCRGGGHMHVLSSWQHRGAKGIIAIARDVYGHDTNLCVYGVVCDEVGRIAYVQQNSIPQNP